MAAKAWKIETIALVGAGTIGRSWATLFAGKGYRVLLEDVDQHALRVAKRVISSNLRYLVRYRLLTRSKAKDALHNITYEANLAEAVRDAQYVQESIPELMPLKRRIFRQICSNVDDSCIIASSTGGFPMTEIQSGMHRPQRCIVVHPSTHPLYLTKLVELVPGSQTNGNTITSTFAFMKRLGKKPILLKNEIQDYVTNRLQFAFWREAIDMVGKGLVSAEDVDIAFVEVVRSAYSFGYGPFLQLHMRGDSHGLGGVEAALEHYAKVLPSTWNSMARWTRIPKSVRVGVAKSVHQYITKKGLSIRALGRQRDLNLLPIASEVWK
jgi:3-hydroxyacyl-CoA dehydrogenase